MCLDKEGKLNIILESDENWFKENGEWRDKSHFEGSIESFNSLKYDKGTNTFKLKCTVLNNGYDEGDSYSEIYDTLEEFIKDIL